MNTATENLRNDHVHILKLTDVMEQICQSPEVCIKHLESVVHLIKNFADGFHHAKEEDLLFPLMGGKGFSKEQGPIAVMLSEHETGRNYVRGMIENIEKYNKGDADSLSKIKENMLGYVNLLRNHIDKEDNILFRMADNVLKSNEQQLLLSQFDKVESEVGKEVIQNFILQINELSKAYNI
jgi:hemerythrin-like domain-containing protein